MVAQVSTVTGLVVVCDPARSLQVRPICSASLQEKGLHHYYCVVVCFVAACPHAERLGHSFIRQTSDNTNRSYGSSLADTRNLASATPPEGPHWRVSILLQRPYRCDFAGSGGRPTNRQTLRRRAGPVLTFDRAAVAAGVGSV